MFGSLDVRFPASVVVPNIPRRDGVCVHDGPWAGITFADKSHARLRLQRSIEPRHSVRGASSYFDLYDVRHYVSSALKTRSQLNKAYVIVAGAPSSCGDMSHRGL